MILRSAAAAGGLKPCHLHRNVLGKRSEMEGGEGVLVTCHDHSKFVLNDNDRIYHSADLRLAARRLWADGRMTKSRLLDLAARPFSELRGSTLRLLAAQPLESVAAQPL